MGHIQGVLTVGDDPSGTMVTSPNENTSRGRIDSASVDTFAIIAEPNRRRILDLLNEQQHSVGELSERLALSQPAVSKHLRVLRQAHLVHAQVDAQRRVYRLSPMPLLELEAWLEPYRKYWNERLDALGRHLDRRAGERPPTTSQGDAEAQVSNVAEPAFRRRPRGSAPARPALRRKVKI
jgi:DNA-binding transcriptional ArsR family regulator